MPTRETLAQAENQTENVCVRVSRACVLKTRTNQEYERVMSYCDEIAELVRVQVRVRSAKKNSAARFSCESTATPTRSPVSAMTTPVRQLLGDGASLLQFAPSSRGG